MAMDATVLANLMVAKINAEHGGAVDEIGSKSFKAIAEAIIEHIQSAADIQIKDAFTAGSPTPQDGGAALKSAWSSQPDLVGKIK